MSPFELKRRHDLKNHRLDVDYATQLNKLPFSVANELGSKKSNDELTGLRSDGFFFHILPRQIALSQRFNLPISLLLMDLDDFTKVNELFGRPNGDKVLRIFGGILQETLPRKTDIICRLDADQYAAILPQTDIDQANLLGVQINNGISEVVLGRFVQTVSIGAGTVSPGQNPNDLLGMAHKHIVQAKARGKNRTVYK